MSQLLNAQCNARAHNGVLRRIAITGGIAEGKSTVLGYLRAMGYETASADEVAKEIFAMSEIQSAIGVILGLEPPVAASTLLAKLSDASVRHAVNAITHPLILARLCELSAPFIEVPLLIETVLEGEFDRTWVVTCGREEQLNRLAARLGGISSAEALVKTQLTSRVKIPFADCVIRTNRRESTVKRCVLVAVQRDLR